MLVAVNPQNTDSLVTDCRGKESFEFFCIFGLEYCFEFKVFRFHRYLIETLNRFQVVRTCTTAPMATHYHTNILYKQKLIILEEYWNQFSKTVRIRETKQCLLNSTLVWKKNQIILFEKRTKSKNQNGRPIIEPEL